jgi:hypothetical protein
LANFPAGFLTSLTSILVLGLKFFSAILDFQLWALIYSHDACVMMQSGEPVTYPANEALLSKLTPNMKRTSSRY